MHRLCVFLIGLWSSVFSAEILVDDIEAFSDAVKVVEPGDRIVLKNGTWENALLKVRAVGTKEKPITIKAETLGKVVLTGDSRIALSGRYIVVDGLWFQNPTGSESIELRINPKETASDCRITNCAVTDDREESGVKGVSRFVSVYGSRNRVDHCWLEGKTSEGPSLVVWLEEGREAAHRFDHNYFGPRPRLGRNGGETMRIGDSRTSMITASCTVEHNLFERCDGEAECISNKSCGNVYRYNRFVAVSGALTLRHGNRCRVEKNLFSGEGAKGTGGVRIIGEDHIVKGNWFENLAGDRERSALCLMMGIPDSPANGYFQVKRASVTGNTFLNCDHNILVGWKGDKKATLPPVETKITGNWIQTNAGEAFEILCDVEGVIMEDNVVEKSASTDDSQLPEGELAGPSWRE